MTDEISELRAVIARLEQRIETLETDLLDTQIRLADTVIRDSGSILDIFKDQNKHEDRLDNLEAMVFPNMASDMAAARKIVTFADTKSPKALDVRPQTTGNDPQDKVK